MESKMAPTNRILATLFLMAMVLLPQISALPRDAELSIDFVYPQPSGNITNEYINNTYINQTLELNSTQFETGEPATIKTSWLTQIIEGVSKWANYWTRTENINQTGYNISADYYFGNASYMTGIPTPDLSDYMKLDQSTPQTITDGTPIFSNGLNVKSDNQKIIMGTNDNTEFYFSGSNQIYNTTGYNYFYTRGVNYPVTIGSDSGQNRINSQIGLSIMSANIPNGVDTGFYIAGGSSDYINFYTGGSIRLKLGSLSGNVAFYPNTDNSISLGGSSNEFKNLFIDGIAYIDEIRQNDNEKHYFGTANDASIYYDATNLIFNTSVVGSGIAYFSNNVSATGYITRTSVFDKSKGTALNYIKDANEYLGTKGNINHKAFYGYIEQKVTDFSRPVIDYLPKEECYTDKDEKEKCSIIYEPITTYPYTKIEDGVDLGKEIDVLRQAVYELKLELEKVKSETCSIKLFSWCLK